MNTSRIRQRCILLLLLITGVLVTSPLFGLAEEVRPNSFFDLEATLADGQQVSFEDYKGKVVLVVNVSGRCGTTPQLGGLEELYQKYKSQGFEVFAFPSTDFAPDKRSNEELKFFCESEYHTTFPLFSNGKITGPEKQEVFSYLIGQCPEDYRSEIGFNFEKFLVGRDGRLKARFGSFTGPTSGRMERAIEAQLERSLQ